MQNKLKTTFVDRCTQRTILPHGLHWQTTSVCVLTSQRSVDSTDWTRTGKVHAYLYRNHYHTCMIQVRFTHTCTAIINIPASYRYGSRIPAQQSLSYLHHTGKVHAYLYSSHYHTCIIQVRFTHTCTAIIIIPAWYRYGSCIPVQKLLSYLHHSGKVHAYLYSTLQGIFQNYVQCIAQKIP